MTITIEIPKEFEDDYSDDKFEDFFTRIIVDLQHEKCLCGNYEMETLAMLTDAFGNSEVIK